MDGTLLMGRGEERERPGGQNPKVELPPLAAAKVGRGYRSGIEQHRARILPFQGPSQVQHPAPLWHTTISPRPAADAVFQT